MVKNVILADYIRNNQMVYQQVDGLIEIGSEEDSKMLSELIMKHGYELAKRDELIANGWEIAEWAIDTDSLIFVSNYVICITDVMKKEMGIVL